MREQTRVEGVRVLLLSRSGSLLMVAAKERSIPVGIPFRRAGNGWAVVDVELVDELLDEREPATHRKAPR